MMLSEIIPHQSDLVTMYALAVTMGALVFAIAYLTR